MSLLWLNDRECENPEFSGNKGANLAKLQRFGYKVPQGFCITEDASAREIKQALKKLSSPWAVRSSSSAEDSAGLAFPGIFETVLGLNTTDDVIKAVKKVISSKNTEIVKRYADQNNIDSRKIQMVVVVQTLVNPTCSGVAFSQNPINGEETVVIEANWGLGETLVDGSVSPDYYEIDRSGKIVESRIGTKKIKAVFESGKVKRIETSPQERDTATLTNAAARKLALIVENIAKDFESPQDVEWAIVDDQIYILQSRPITTLKKQFSKQAPEKEVKWHLITQKQYPVFGRFFMQEAFRDEMPKSLGLGFENFKSLYSGIYADEVRFEQVKDLLIKKLQQDPREIERIAKDWQNECRALIDFSRSLPKKLKNYSNEQLIDLIEDTVRHFKRSASYIFLHHGLANYFEHWLNDLLLRNQVSEADKKQYFQILSSPTKNTGLVEASTRLEEILRIEDKKKLAEAVSKHAVTFAWVGYDTGIGHDLTESEVLDQLKNLAKHVHPKTNQSEVLSRLKLTKLDKIYLSLMHKILYLGTYRAESHMRAGANFQRVLTELADRLKSNYDDLVQFTLPEIKQALLSGKMLDTSLAKERRYKFGAVMIKGKISIYSGDKVDEIHEKVSMPTDLQHISGMTAYAGKVKGTAKLVITKADFSKVKNGDIVISKMTSPDFMVILNKCSGIITDIGGITCHAAIISRELHKPCLIGTVYATIFFKDGDLVELDANEGVAKKIVNE